MTEWYNANGISKSTLVGWIRSKNVDITKPKNKAKFVEITFPTESESTQKMKEKNTTNKCYP